MIIIFFFCFLYKHVIYMSQSFLGWDDRVCGSTNLYAGFQNCPMIILIMSEERAFFFMLALLMEVAIE